MLGHAATTKRDERVKERQDIKRVKDEFIDHHARLANEIVGRSLTVSRVVDRDAFDVDRFFRDPVWPPGPCPR